MAPAEVLVSPSGEGEYAVRVREGGGESTHRVRVGTAEHERYGPAVDASVLVEESFRFLLEREPKEAILPSFDLGTIERYFPEYPDEIGRRLDALAEP